MSLGLGRVDAGVVRAGMVDTGMVNAGAIDRSAAALRVFTWFQVAHFDGFLVHIVLFSRFVVC